jgi:hypothetical protein
MDQLNRLVAPLSINNLLRALAHIPASLLA